MVPSIVVLCAVLSVFWSADGAYIDDRRTECRTEGCVTQAGCVPRFSQYNTALYCSQRCVIERCRPVSEEPARKPCHRITSVANGMVLAATESYDRRDNVRYASLVSPNAGERDRWYMTVGPDNLGYYIQNSDTGEYLRASENDYVYLVAGRPSDESFLFRPDLVRGSWSCVLLQSVCYRGYLFGERYNGAGRSFALMTRDLQRCYQESLWSISTVSC
ncbi:uncharacterized protein LOC128725652 [Anopheles nili]|uniref:uncharacterized protein LOC128725652 n=1 Tax=Anopheles nili TaxID=185578 RepID=UPI00237B4649|nr:uncharacterized protein LOC128725652 [Anopheles nili]